MSCCEYPIHVCINMATVKCVRFVITDLLIFVFVGVVALVIRRYASPYERGFFKDDQSLMFPYHPSTITSTMLYAVGFTIPVAVITITEIHCTYKSMRSGQFAEVSEREKWIMSWFHIIASFFFGAACTHLLTDIPKYVIGRLRPHFFDVCNPDWTLVNDTSGYIETAICTGSDLDLIQEARLSFPSGHSSMAVYCALFFILYLESKPVWIDVPLLRPLVQLIAFSMAFYTCLSRISDYKHHWSDVLAGGILGTIIAFASFRCVKVSRIIDPTEEDGNII